jgi:hypothetical protein
VCKYIKEWFKPIFPLFLTSAFYKLKPLRPMVEYAPPPLPTSVLLAKLRLCIQILKAITILSVDPKTRYTALSIAHSFYGIR